MNRFDLLETLEKKDPTLFGNEFKLIDFRNMGKPTLDRLYNHDLFHH